MFRKFIRTALLFAGGWALCFLLLYLPDSAGFKADGGLAEVHRLWLVIIFIQTLMILVPKGSFFRSFRILWGIWLMVMLAGIVCKPFTFIIVLEVILKVVLTVESFFIISLARRCNTCKRFVVMHHPQDKACPHCGNNIPE